MRYDGGVGPLLDFFAITEEWEVHPKTSAVLAVLMMMAMSQGIESSEEARDWALAEGYVEHAPEEGMDQLTDYGEWAACVWATMVKLSAA